MTSAAPGEPPLAVYLGAAGALVPPDGSDSSSCTRSFHESRAGGTACAPSSSSACVGVGGTDASDSPPPEPPRGLELPPRCGSCGAATALVMQIHAPLLPSHPDRALLFFACVADGDKCSRRQEAWVGVRVQGPRAKRAAEAEGVSPAAATLPPPPSAPAVSPPPAAPVATAAADSWGLDDEEGGSTGGWGVEGDDGATKNDEKRVDFSRLGAELSSAAEALQISGSSSKSKPRAKKHPYSRHEQGEDDDGEGAKHQGLALPLWTQPGEAGPTLPSFYVSWAPEEDAGRFSSAASAYASASAQRQGKGGSDPESSIDDAHVAELLARYEASERGSGSGSSTAAAAAAAANASSSSAAGAGEAAEALASSRLADSVGWSGEAYEPDSTPGASSAFLAFAKKVGRNPEQVARYYHCGRRSEDPRAATTAAAAASAAASSPSRLLWPAAQGPPDPPPPCPSCGSAREYEAQLMAPLVALIDEAGQWEEEEEEEEQEEVQGGDEQQQQQRQRRRRRQGRPALGRAPESWEWLTVAMATCLAGCSGGGHGGGGGGEEEAILAVEEAVAVAFE